MILAVDTSGPVPVVAVASGGAVLAGMSGTAPRAHAEEIGPLLRAALAAGEPTGVAVGRGPGAFTGLRVGLVAAAVFGFARGIPVVGLCSLDCVAQGYGMSDGWAVTDARRGEVFLARYVAGERQGPPRVLPRAEARARIGGDAACGDVALLTDPDRRVRGTTTIDPTALAAVALRAVAAEDPLPAEPDYLRRPDVTWSAANGGGGA